MAFSLFPTLRLLQKCCDLFKLFFSWTISQLSGNYPKTAEEHDSRGVCWSRQQKLSIRGCSLCNLNVRLKLISKFKKELQLCLLLRPKSFHLLPPLFLALHEEQSYSVHLSGNYKKRPQY